jgi:hypothetical protein
MVMDVFNMLNKRAHRISSHAKVILTSSSLVSSVEFQIQTASNACTFFGTSNEDSYLQGMKIAF